MSKRGTQAPEYKIKTYHLIRLSHPFQGVYYIPFTQLLEAKQITRLQQGYPSWDVSTISVSVKDLDTTTGVKDFRPFTNGETQFIAVQFLDVPSWDTTDRVLQ